MNNPARAALQRHYEASILSRLGGDIRGRRALEIGCGRGVGAEIVVERFGADHVDAFDLDPDMVRRARLRLARFRDRVHVWMGSATRIAARDGTYEAVFDFGIIHHIPDWRTAVAEVRRVLKPGGRFYFEEVTRHALERWTYKTFFEHPEHDRFSAEDFIAELEARGLHVGDRCQTRFFGDFVLGVAVRNGD